jgi:hypothetical protein
MMAIFSTLLKGLLPPFTPQMLKGESLSHSFYIPALDGGERLVTGPAALSIGKDVALDTEQETW